MTSDPSPRVKRGTPRWIPNAVPPGTRLIRLSFEGHDRRFAVHPPPTWDGQSPLPMLLMLHGAGATIEQTIHATGWTQTAEREGFLAVFPEATRPFPHDPPHLTRNALVWNDGHLKSRIANREIDDAGFLRTILREVRARFPIDERRIFVAGFSNGGSMALRMGVELSDQIAAVATVSGYLWIEDPRVSRPVSLLYIIGAHDPLTPPSGGTVNLMPWKISITYPSIREFTARWARMIGCSSEANVEANSNGVTRFAHPPGPDGSEVIQYLIEGMGHVWPGGENLMNERWVGRPTKKILANDVMWRFFLRHPMG